MSIKRIGIDCRLAGKQHAGIGRYIENLVKRLPQIENVEWVLFFFDKQQAEQIFKNQKQYNNIIIKFFPIRHYTLKEQIFLPKLFAKEKLDLLHVPHFNAPIFYKQKIVLTIHDLLWHEQKGTSVTTLPKWQYWLKYLAYKFVAKKAIEKAEKIIVPSQTIKNTLSSYYPKAKNKVEVIYEGTNNEPWAMDHGPLIMDHKLLYVGSLYPHKNIGLVLKVLKDLPDYKLLIAGSRNAFQDRVRKQCKKLGIESQVEFLGFVSDKKLQELYQSVLALVQPSLSEGFGLTGVEAMAAGGVVLASDIEIFQEIYGPAAIYFDPKSTKSFKNALKKLHESNRSELVKKGSKQVEKYDWDEMVQGTTDIYIKVLNSK